MCQNQYFLEYVLGWRNKTNKAAVKGTVVHKVLELYAKGKLAQQNGRKSFTDEETGRHKVFHMNQQKLLKKCYDLYTEPMPLNFTPRDFKDCDKWVNLALNDYDGKFDPRNRDIVEAECFFDIEVPQKWASYDYNLNGEQLQGQLALKGTVDLITRIDDNLYEVTDYKTGQRKNWATDKVKEYEDLEKDTQLLLYYYALRNKWPDKDFLITIYFIRDGGPFTMQFDDSSIALAEKRIREKFNMVKNTKQPSLLSFDRSSWKCKNLCRFSKDRFENDHMCMCERVQKDAKHEGMEKAVAKHTSPGFDCSYYHSPGSVDK